MADVFISYSRADTRFAQDVVWSFEGNNLSVFYDRKIPATKEWPSVLARELATSKVVLVLWSHSSKRSTWVIREATEAHEADKLVIAWIDQSRQLPDRFELIQTIDIAGWQRGVASRKFDDLLEVVSRMVDQPKTKDLAETNLRELGITRNQSFVGRETALSSIRKLSALGSPPSIATIVGPSGIGKSQLAAEFAYRHRCSFVGIWWIDASDAMIDESCRRLAARLKVLPYYPTTLSDVMALLRERLSKGCHLLILDGLEAPSRLVGLQIDRPSQILVTTVRSDLPRDLVTQIYLDSFTPEESASLLGGNGDTDTLEKIAATVGHHPLALDLVHALLENYPDATLDEALDRLRRYNVGDDRNPINRVAREQHAAGYPLAVHQSLSLHLPELVGTPEGRILRLAAYCHTSGIPIDLFCSEFIELGISRDRARDLLHSLASRSVVTYRGTIALHALTQSAIRGDCEFEDYCPDLDELVSLLCQVFDDLPPDRWDLQQPYVPHALSAIQHVERIGNAGRAGFLANQVGVSLRLRGSYEMARRAFDSAYLLTQKRYGYGYGYGYVHESLSSILSNIAGLESLMGNTVTALEKYREAERILCQCRSSYDLSVARLKNNIGRTLTKLGECEEAYAHLTQAYEIAIEAGNLSLAAACINNLGLMALETGDLNIARGMFETADRLMRESMGTDHPERALVLHNLATVLEETGEKATASKMYEEALVLCMRYHGPRASETVGVATSLLDLSSVDALVRRQFGDDDANALREAILKNKENQL